MNDEPKKFKFKSVPKILNDSWVVGRKEDEFSYGPLGSLENQMKTGEYEDWVFDEEHCCCDSPCGLYCEIRIGINESLYVEKFVSDGSIDGKNLEQVKEKLKEYVCLDEPARKKVIDEFWASDCNKSDQLPQINKKTPGSYPIYVTSEEEGTQVYNHPKSDATFEFGKIDDV